MLIRHKTKHLTYIKRKCLRTSYTKLLHECISFVTLGYRQLRAQRQNKSFVINVLTKFVQMPTAMQHCIHMLRYRCPEQKSLSSLLEKWLIKYSENCL